MHLINQYSAYLETSNRIFSLWHEAKNFVYIAHTTQELNEVIECFEQLSVLLAFWPVQELEKRHQQSLLTMLDNTITWVIAQRDDGPVEAAWADLEEAWRATYVESCRFVRIINHDQEQHMSEQANAF